MVFSFVGALLLILASNIPSICAVGGRSEQKEGEKHYPWLVDGLKQFPYPYKVADNKILATVVGCGFPSSEKGAVEAQFVELELVTIEGEKTQVMVGGDYVQLQIFWHEIHPTFGKRFWQPVLKVKRMKSGARQWWHEIDFNGRFFTVNDKQDTNKVDHYENEVFNF